MYLKITEHNCLYDLQPNTVKRNFFEKKLNLLSIMLVFDFDCGIVNLEKSYQIIVGVWEYNFWA